MLDPNWAATRPLLWIALVAMLVLLTLRTIRKDRREYQRFKRYRGTVKRQATFRRWLRESFLTFGGLSVVLLLLAGSYVGPLLAELQGGSWVSGIRSNLWIPAVIAVIVIVLTWIGIRAARHDDDGIAAVGDIAALLPRNRQEVRLGALLSINAGIVEELAFRLAIPALVFGASGSAIAAVAVSVLLFGALHLYQGAAGIIGTTIVGIAMMALYVVSGSIVAPIVLHVLIDLRSLVLIPVAVMGVHKVDGRLHPWLPAVPRTPPATPRTPPAAAAAPEAAPAAATSADGPAPPQPHGDHDDHR
ncbi:hypothetical protein GCM10007382_08000 [Salinibacterium xinjiangense]|uniref:Membrane protease YdiL, CAAX protease family n=1 Tax=Salinibacterium xinjiangense TaxID=386302 RepID=A0A2C8ZAU4_9MICO|nr:CPBP family intramembrane glutamic endopeptidase [Salinibacterium xinjiangense]GGK90318.1 hypothetical protein GCM10007382_08000 [Salinibacterium xinjiangense]SOE61243.1 Membrane protease YdiL, CAAX protease family [Salinibacterium xinjiangense]